MSDAIRAEWAAHTARSSREASTLSKQVPTWHDTPDVPLRSKVLQDAEAAINGDRDQAYGAPAVNFMHIADLWNVLLGPKLKDNADITSGDVAALMIALKLARSMTSPAKYDHWVDAAGYAALAAEINQVKP